MKKGNRFSIEGKVFLTKMVADSMRKELVCPTVFSP